jgi:hypothetical protein
VVEGYERIRKPPNERYKMPESQDAADLDPARIAFGAVTGATIGFAVRPLVKLLPDYWLLPDLVQDIAEAAVHVVLMIVFARLAIRIKRERLDNFLDRHLGRTANFLSLIVTCSIWLSAGRPRSLRVALVLALTFVTVLCFLVLCGKLARASLHVMTDEQASESAQLREEEAGTIALEDPYIAPGLFAIDAVGRTGGAIARGCASFLLAIVGFCAVVTAAALNARALFGVEVGWAVTFGVIVAVSAVRIVALGWEFGEKERDTVPLHEKHRAIMDGIDKGDSTRK